MTDMQDLVKCGVTPESITTLQDNEIFVFGSNLAGAHGGGAAAYARRHFGAINGIGVGLQGQSYAIPTMHGGVDAIKPFVTDFITFAKANPDKHFLVTKIGCGIAGFRIEDIAPLFSDAVDVYNISLPQEFIDEIIFMDPCVTWDDKSFLNELLKYKGKPSLYYKVKELRAHEYQNTIELVRQGYYINGKGERVSLDYYGAGEAILYSSEIHNAPGSSPVYPNMEIQTLNVDCLVVGQMLKAEGYNPAVLNLASRTNPGGGVINGAGAQEETLFRRTDLFRSLYQFADYAPQYGLKKAKKQYPLDRNFGGVYTPKALIFREDESTGYRLMDTPCEMAFIAVAAINRPELTPDNRIAPHLVEPTKNKIRTILRIGVKHKHDALVLGALGCGAFCNPPAHIAQLFREVFIEPEFRGAFRRVVFAILDDHNAHLHHNPKGNFLPFVEVFG